LFGNYGVTDRLDLGVAVPVVSLRLAGERTNTYRGNTFLQARASAFVTGLADVALRAQYSALQTGNFGLAGNADLRLPTGTEENLLGAGRAAIRLSGVATVERGRIGSHLTGGFARGGVSDEWDWGGALVAAATPRISVSGELMGRHLDALARIAEVTAPHPLIIGVETTRLLPSTTGTNTLFALAGFKWNIASTWLLNASLLFPLSDVGLTARVTPSIALDYTLSR
jgi:hypothetical protein